MSSSPVTKLFTVPVTEVVTGYLNVPSGVRTHLVVNYVTVVRGVRLNYVDSSGNLLSSVLHPTNLVLGSRSVTKVLTSKGASLPRSSVQVRTQPYPPIKLTRVL